MRLAGAEIAGGLPIVDAGAVELLAEPGDADADCREDRCFHDLGHGEIADATDKYPGEKTERRGEQAGPQSADTGGKQDGRDEEQEGAVPVQQRTKPEPEQEQCSDGHDSEPIVRRSGARKLKCSRQFRQLAGFGK
jgi:hypothetical protein